MNHSFNMELAEKYGIEEAILLENLAFWIKKNQVNEKHYYEKKTWTYNSRSAFAALFPYIHPSKIYRALKGLEKQGVLLVGNFNNNQFDRTSWYTIINEEILNHYGILENNTNPESMGCSKRDNGVFSPNNLIVHNEQTIPDINTDINKNKEKIYKKKNLLLPEERKIIPSDFDRWYNSYPRKKKKGTALSSFIKLCNNKQAPTIGLLMSKLEEHKKQQAWSIEKYIPYPSTYLNSLSFLDEVDTPQSTTNNTPNNQNVDASVLSFVKRKEQ